MEGIARSEPLSELLPLQVSERVQYGGRCEYQVKDSTG